MAERRCFAIMMSDDNLDESTADNMCCANCGIAGVDEIKLEKCTDCRSVSYCSDKCREEHREQHEEECKKRMEEEFHDRQLFNQPDISHLGECPICFLPMPIYRSKYTFYPCCSETICKGCVYAHHVSNGGKSCPFCRESISEDKEENNKRKMKRIKEESMKRLMKRIKANDPAALREMGAELSHRQGDYDGAFEYLTKAAELGDLEAHSQLGRMYYVGNGVEKDEEKSNHHCEKAAIGGHPDARFGLGVIELGNGKIERAVKHFIIAANLGHENSMKQLWGAFKDGYITKEELDATLRTHQAAINATKSEQREIAGAAFSRD